MIRGALVAILCAWPVAIAPDASRVNDELQIMVRREFCGAYLRWANAYAGPDRSGLETLDLMCAPWRT